MALDFAPFLTRFQTVLATVWPEILPGNGGGGQTEAEFASRVPWDDITVPYAVLLIPAWPRAEGYGVANLVFQPTVSVYYVATTNGTAKLLRPKLTALVNALWPADPLPAVGQVLDILEISVGDDLPPNVVFSSADRAQRAGRVQVACLVGVTNV